MPTITLTARTVAGLKPSSVQVDYWDASRPGFGLRISPGGQKTWVLFYRHGKRPRRLTLGTYPALSLAKARKQAKEKRAAVDLGADPASEKQAERTADTFGELAALYLEKHAKRKKRSWTNDARILDVELLPLWRHTRLVDLTRREVRQVIEAIAERPAPIMANRVLALVRKMFNFALQRDLCETNPCQALARPGQERQRERVLTEDEIRALWTALDAEADAGRAAIATYYRLRLLTAQRGQEVERMRWSDVDAGERVWTIPGSDTKNGLAHRVPLSPAVWALLEAHREATDTARTAVNAGRARKRRPPLEPSQWVFPSPRRDKGDRPWGRNLQNAIERIRGEADWTAHDLRRTAASMMTGGGVPRFVVGKILNHVEPGVTKVYDRFSYDPEKRAALDWWALRLQAITDGTRGATVLPFAAVR